MNATLLRGKINGPAWLFPEASPQPGSFFFFPDENCAMLPPRSNFILSKWEKQSFLYFYFSPSPSWFIPPLKPYGQSFSWNLVNFVFHFSVGAHRAVRRWSLSNIPCCNIAASLRALRKDSFRSLLISYSRASFWNVSNWVRNCQQPAFLWHLPSARSLQTWFSVSDTCICSLRV